MRTRRATRSAAPTSTARRSPTRSFGAASHGPSSGTGASRTYRPTPNYNGSDSFTFKANDGSLDSNTATFNLTITDVNDAPSRRRRLEDDRRGRGAQLPGCDLTANDSAGPANESGQTLTVISVDPRLTRTAPSSLVAGTVTYTPGADYNGPASFSYTVQDNGTTNGAPDFKTATGYRQLHRHRGQRRARRRRRQRHRRRGRQTCSSTCSANDSTGPGQRERPDADDHRGRATPAHGTAVVQRRQGHLHAGRRLQRPRLLHLHGHRQRHDQRRRRSASRDTATVTITVTEVNDAPIADERQRRPWPRTARVVVDVLGQRLDRARPTRAARR